MKKRKKLSRKDKERRRIREAEKALSKGYSIDRRAVPSTVSVPSAVVRETGMFLPVKQIKLDLLHNLLFATLSTGVLLAFKFTDFGFEQVRHLFRF